MTEKELYEKMVALVPVKVDDVDFKERLKKVLNDYQKLVAELNEEDRPDEWDKLIGRLKQLCAGIIRAVDSEYRGMRHSAYTSIKNQLDGRRTESSQIEGLAYTEIIRSVKIGEVFYRMRKVDIEERRKLSIDGMFHIPLDQRGLVTTQRYSVPGYPCLYLAHTIYGCWEEMGRPDFGTVMVSRFKSKQKFRVLDLRVPSKATWEENMKGCIQFFPLVIAAMMQTKSGKDAYKPEYTIPQLLTEWVISHNRDGKKGRNFEEIMGIVYTSAQKNDDFDYPADCYDNYAIPVLQSMTRSKYCPRLKDMFELSKPSYFDLEVLKQGEIYDGGEFGFDEQNIPAENMRASHFGQMEEYLKKYDLLSLEG